MIVGAGVSRLLFFLKIFVIFGVGLALLFHFVTRESMPWWPDTAIVGLYMGGFATLVALSRSLDRRGWRHLRGAAKATRLWWKTRNTV